MPMTLNGKTGGWVTALASIPLTVVVTWAVAAGQLTQKVEMHNAEIVEHRNQLIELRTGRAREEAILREILRRLDTMEKKLETR